MDSGLQALMLLNRLRLAAAFRARIKQAATIKGILFIATIVLFVVFVRASIAESSNSDLVRTSHNIEGLLSLGLLAACLLTLLTSTSSAMHFSSTEVNILFSAPISRAALVINKVVSYAAGAILSALLLIVLLPSFGMHRLVMFVSIVLTLLFVQLLSASLSMGGSLAKKRWPILPGRRAFMMFWLPGLLALLPLLAFYGVLDATKVHGGLDVKILSSASMLIESRWMQWLLAPFSLFSGFYGATDSVGMLVLRIGMSLAVLAILLISIVIFDRHLIEESASSSIAAQHRWQTILKTGSLWQGKTSDNLVSRRAPTRLGSWASIAWSQWLRLVRKASSLAYGLPCIALVAGICMGFFGTGDRLTKLIPWLFFLFVFLLPKMLTYDFRGAPETIEKLKTLPVSSWAICLGELATPVLFSSLLQWVAIVGMLGFMEPALIKITLVIGLLLLPLNFILYATENSSFLLAPVRLVPVGRVDFDFLGRQLVDFLVKCLALCAAVAVVVVVGWAVGSRYPESWALLAITVILMLLVEMVLALYLVVFSYRRFDTTKLARE